jgi:maleate isomerase
MAQNYSIPSHKIGLLVPSSNSILETDFFHLSPNHWSIHSTRMYLEDISLKALARMLDDYAPMAARDLASIEPDLVVFGSSIASILHGNNGEEVIIRRIEEIVHAPVFTVMKAARQMLKKNKVTQIAVLTPYSNELNQQIRASLEQDDFKILRIEGFNLARYGDIARQPINEIIRLSKWILDGISPEALFICGSNLPALSNIQTIKAEIPYPIFCTNQAIFENILDFQIKHDTLSS